MKYPIIYFTALILCVTGCAKKETPKPKEVKEEAPASAASADSVQQKALSFNLEGLTDKGAKKWEVKGDSAEVVSESEILLDNIVAKAYGAEAEAVITADKGVYDKSKNNVKLEKNVKVTIETTREGASDFIDFSSQMAGSSKSREVSADRAKKMKTLITCDGEVEFDYENDHAYFNKNVKVVSEDGDIDADKITVNLDPATKRINQIVAEGDVKITRGENITYSEKATYITAEKKVILSGRPRLIIYHEGDIEKTF